MIYLYTRINSGRGMSICLQAHSRPQFLVTWPKCGHPCPAALSITERGRCLPEDTAQKTYSAILTKIKIGLGLGIPWRLGERPSSYLPKALRVATVLQAPSVSYCPRRDCSVVVFVEDLNRLTDYPVLYPSLSRCNHQCPFRNHDFPPYCFRFSSLCLEM